MKKKYYYGNPVVVFGWSTHEGDKSFEWSYTKFPDGTSPEENKEYPLSEVWDKDLIFDGIHRDNKGGTSEIEVHYLDRSAYKQEGKWICYISNSFVEGNEFKLSNGYTKDDVHQQFDKTKSYLIRRNGSSGPPKVIFIYKNEEGSDCYAEVRPPSIGTEISAPTEEGAGITHYTFGDWNKVKAHYDLTSDKYIVDKNLEEVTFPHTVTEFNEYYRAELVPKEYNLQLDSALFFNTTDQKTILTIDMVKLGEFDLQANVESTSIKIKSNGTKITSQQNSNNFSYKSEIQVSFYFPIQEYIPNQLQVTSADQSHTVYDLTAGDNTYTTMFEMPGQDSSIKILFTKNDTTN